MDGCSDLCEHVLGAADAEFPGLLDEQLDDFAVLGELIEQVTGATYAEAVREAGPLRHVALIHGENRPRNTLRALLEERGFPSVHTPNQGDRLEV